MTEEQRKAIALLVADAESAAWRAFATYNRKTKRYDFNEQMWEDGRPQQFMAVQVIRSMLATPALPDGEAVAWRWKYREEHDWQHCSAKYTPPAESIREPLYASPPPVSGPMPPGSTITVIIPEGYESTWDFLNDCGLERAPREMVPEIPFDPTNHHNALKCPYCNPDGLVLAPPVSGDVRAALIAARNWIVSNTTGENDPGDGIMYERGWWSSDTKLMEQIDRALSPFGEKQKSYE